MTPLLRPLRSTITQSYTRLSSIKSIHSTSCRRQHFLDADTETFDKAISAETSKGKVVLVDFYATWCNPCKLLSPILEKLTNDPTLKSGSGRSLDLVTVDTDAEFNLGLKYKVRSLPTVIAFRDGEVVDQFTGALNEPGVRAFLAKV